MINDIKSPDLVYATHRASTGETYVHIVKGNEETISRISHNQMINMMLIFLPSFFKNMFTDEMSRRNKK